MQAEIITICDAATNHGGKLNILGSFDTIWAIKLPFNHAQCALAFKVRFSPREAGEHKFTINLVNFDGQHVMPSINGNLNVKFAPNQQTNAINFVINLQGLKINAFGEYAINLAFNGKQLCSLPLYVLEKAPNPIRA